ncbi:MAG: chemotaxis protein CheB [Proteobacteria bacterium]|nr:chemotaxis protein CheB [Pseudomonadota bacterium]
MAAVWPEVDAVVLGASAGGVEALLALLPALPTAAPAPSWLIVLHRGVQSHGDPSLAALLARACPLPLAEAEDRQPLCGGQVLLAPADYHLLVDRDGAQPVAALSVDARVRWSRPAIDPLFESAAQVFGDRLLAIVLTGASADGSDGAAAVRAAGGELWVQDPDEATVATMPRAARQRAGGADRVLTLAALRAALAATAARGADPL